MFSVYPENMYRYTYIYMYNDYAKIIIKSPIFSNVPQRLIKTWQKYIHRRERIIPI